MKGECVMAEEVKKESASKVIVRVLKDKGLDASAKEVAEACEKEGVKASVGLINNVKFRLRAGKAERKQGRRRRRRRMSEAASPSVVHAAQGSFDALLEVKALASRFGGTSKVREVLDTLDKLAS